MLESLQPSDLSAASSTAHERSLLATPYSHGIEHLEHCLARIDLLLLRALEQRPTRAITDHLSFAAITDTEIQALLTQPQVAVTQAIDERIRRLDDEISDRVAASLASGVRLPLIELQRIFSLAEIECRALLACCAPELDRKYERVYGYLHDDMGRRLPSVGLLMELLAPHGDLAERRAIFDRQAPLLRYELLRIGDEAGAQPFASRLVSLDERIATFLAGSRRSDWRIGECLLPSSPDNAALLGTVQREARDKITAAIGMEMNQARARRKPLIYLSGSPAAAVDEVVHAAAAASGLAVVHANAAQLAASPLGFATSLFVLLRECLLQQAAAYVSGIDRVLTEDPNQLCWAALVRLLSELGGITFLSGERPWIWNLPPSPIALLPLAIEPADFAEQIEVWRQLTCAMTEVKDIDLHEIASTHPMAPAEISDTVQLAQSAARLRGARDLSTADLKQACRTRSRSGLVGIARRIEPKYGWDDIVLPAAALEQLRALCSQAKRRSLVFGDWGFERKLSLGKGLNALFAGPPGTGKTMAAEVIASDLALELYKIDLSQVVSKYVGETEKNLSRVFDGAARAHAILLFDEADALLGKRSAVKDAHDRYANTEIAYLLQKMEEYEGITILTTNLRQNMDDAFTRRMRFIVEFPFPDDADRLRIWQRVWPREVPLGADVDLGRLTRQHRLSGGSVRNVALAAAFMAAEEGSPVGMQHLLRATKRELTKMGRLVIEAEPSP